MKRLLATMLLCAVAIGTAHAADYNIIASSDSMKDGTRFVLTDSVCSEYKGKSNYEVAKMEGYVVFMIDARGNQQEAMCYTVAKSMLVMQLYADTGVAISIPMRNVHYK
uniref:hypothetical protein n=1 Tax=Cupriavidus yeoncheonensis TaxID=1462994 RepID=UPI003F49841E